ncbi:MAG: PEP-CTERM/exosortase system-associated acyltransferase [Spongiibacteraceae bacterium]
MVSALPLPSSYTDSFKRQFDIQLASSDELRQRVFDLRFRVFCEELGYAMKNRDGLESDAHDQSSLHCLVHHLPTQTDVGCVRVVLPRERGGGLPFETFGLRYVDRKLLDWSKLDPTRCCELSRLAVIDEFRRPLALSDANAPVGATTSANRRSRLQLPSVGLALYQATIALTLQHQFEWVFMVGEPRLQRHVLTFGIHMRQVSPTFEYFGQRAVFVTTMADTLATIDAWDSDKKDLYRFVNQRLTGNVADLISDTARNIG